MTNEDLSTRNLNSMNYFNCPHCGAMIHIRTPPTEIRIKVETASQLLCPACKMPADRAKDSIAATTALREFGRKALNDGR